MDRVNIDIWGRNFELRIIYDCFDDEEILESQKEVLEDFLDNPGVIDQAKMAVVEYCKKYEHGEKWKIDDIFSYVRPSAIFVVRAENIRQLAILCDYKFDPEHGLAIVFENLKIKMIGPQDIVL